tara:strand:+ start:183 stop:716 length:534 start_codon:yes stop_codon:yes gene_type:complete
MKILLTLFVLLFVGFSVNAEWKENTWVAEYSDSIGSTASVNGLVTHGDRFYVRIIKSDTGFCELGELFFSFYTTKNNPNILNLNDQRVSVNFKDENLYGKIMYPNEFLLGHKVIIWFGYNLLDDLIELYKNRETLKLELLDSNEFQASEYFDILINEWSTNNFESAIYEAKELCKSN